MNFRDYTKKNSKEIQHAINGALSGWDKRIATQTASLHQVSKLLLQSNTGGKTVRGTLVCLGYDVCTSRKSTEMYTIAAAYELLHTSLLIHDDIIDKSPLRRGHSSVYQQLGGDHYGISQAICLGDAGFFLAIQLLNKLTVSNEIKQKIIAQFARTVLDTITGQMLDIKFSNKIAVITEKDCIKIAELKTAQYTIAGPLVLGALLAGANEQHLSVLSRFGNELGIAFQIKDDVLGIFGDEKTVGKSVTADIEEGKNTLLITYAYYRASKAQREILDRYYGKGMITPKQRALIKEILQETGAVVYAEEKIQAYASSAEQLILSITKQSQQQALLTDCIAYVTKRAQ